MVQAPRPKRRLDKRKPATPRWIRRQLSRCWCYSALLLGVTVAGTVWLSDLTARGPSLAQQEEAIGGRAPLAWSRRPAAVAARPLLVRVRPRAQAHPAQHQSRPEHWPLPSHLPAQWDAAARLPVAAPEPARYLSPLQMPSETLHYALMRAHHYGRVVLGVRLDPAGGVAGLWLQQPSGDTVLDSYALQRVRDWRFAPPPPGDDTGLLALRFEAQRR